MAKTFKQIELFGESKETRIYRRNRLGQFSKEGMTNEEKLFRENNVLKSKIHFLERRLRNKDNYIEILEKNGSNKK